MTIDYLIFQEIIKGITDSAVIIFESNWSVVSSGFFATFSITGATYNFEGFLIRRLFLLFNSY